MIQACAKTDIGKRRNQNQDYVYAKTGKVGSFPNLLILADGMGGHKAGDYASWFLTESLSCFIEKAADFEPVRVFSSAIDLANMLLFEKSCSDPDLQGMGSTLVMAVIDNGQLTCANVGDSRLYVIGNGRIRQITKDHSYVEEMVSQGLIERGSEAYLSQKNIITRAMGIEKKVRPDFFEEELTDEDYILMCSDGLSNMIEDPEILQVVLGIGDLDSKTDKLIRKANENGGSDNISVVLAQYRKGGDSNA